MEAVARTKMNMGGVGDTISNGVGTVVDAVGSVGSGVGGSVNGEFSSAVVLVAVGEIPCQFLPLLTKTFPPYFLI